MAGKLQVLSAAVPRPMAQLVDTLAARDGVNRSEWIRRALEREATERVTGAPALGNTTPASSGSDREDST